MPRINSSERVNSLEREDRFITARDNQSDGAPTAGTLAEFVQSNIVPESANNYILLNRGRNIEQSFIQQNSNIVAAGSSVPMQDDAFNVYSTSASRLVMGSAARATFFASPIVEAGVRIAITNHTIAYTFVTTIDSFNANIGEIILSESIPEDLLNRLDITGGGDNTIVVSTPISLEIDGPVIFNDPIDAVVEQVNNQNNDTGVSIWTGTEVEYLALEFSDFEPLQSVPFNQQSVTFTRASTSSVEFRDEFNTDDAYFYTDATQRVSGTLSDIRANTITFDFDEPFNGTVTSGFTIDPYDPNTIYFTDNGIYIDRVLVTRDTGLARQLVNANQVGTQPVNYWLGTEAEFQELRSQGLIEETTIYDTY